MPVYNETRERQINISHVTKRKLQDGLHYLVSENFFSKWPVEPVNPSGTGFGLKVNLKAGFFSQGWKMPGEPRIYKEFLRRINPMDFNPFTPEQARLMVTAPKLGTSTDAPVLWPQSFDFSLSEVSTKGRLINGKVLSFVWQAINQQDVTIIYSGNKKYVVWLVIPEIEMSVMNCL